MDRRKFVASASLATVAAFLSKMPLPKSIQRMERLFVMLFPFRRADLLT